MNDTRLEYNKRLKEIEIYFETLKFLDDGDCSIKCKDILGVETEKTIDFEYIKEDYSKIKYSIATVEMEMLLSGSLVSCGIHDDPFNFLTYTEQVDFLI